MQNPLFERRDYSLDGKDAIENNFDALGSFVDDELTQQMKNRKSSIDTELIIRRVIASLTT